MNITVTICLVLAIAKRSAGSGERVSEMTSFVLSD